MVRMSASYRKYSWARLNDLGKIGHNVNASILSPFVAETQIWTPAVERVNPLPDGTGTSIFRLTDDGSADISVLGPRRRARYKRAPRVRGVVKVVFRPGGAYPFSDAPLTPAQLALACVLAKEKHIVRVIGARTRKQLSESLAALQVRLAAADLAHMEERIPPSAIAGMRYDERQMRMLDSERQRRRGPLRHPNPGFRAPSGRVLQG
jgi:hypothetical protein